MVILANKALTDEYRFNHTQTREISCAQERHQRDLWIFHPSLPPDPLSPRRPSPFSPFPVRRAQKQIPSSMNDPNGKGSAPSPKQ